jgi:hypothetical protein
MITGEKPWEGPVPETHKSPLWLAAIVAALAAGTVWWLVH